MLIYTANIFIEMKTTVLGYVGMFLHKHFDSGYHPLFFLSEATIKPRGCWYAYKLPTSYYLINTQLCNFNWPLSINFWSQVFRDTTLFTELPSASSFKKVSSSLLITPYFFCNFSWWDLWNNDLFSNHSFTYFLYTFKSIRLFEGSFFELQLFVRPYFYNRQVYEWHLKDYIPSEEDWGISWGQVQRRVFLRWFWTGYWLYLFYDTPWAWRLNYSKDISNLTWLTDAYYRFFTLYNKANPSFLLFTVFLLCTAYTASITLDYAMFACPAREVVYCWLFNWSYFFWISAFSYFLIIRVTNVCLRYIGRNNNLLSFFAPIFIRSPLVQKYLRQFLKFLWFVGACSLTWFVFCWFGPTCTSFLWKIVMWCIQSFTWFLERLLFFVLYLPCKWTGSFLIGFLKAVHWLTDWYEDDYAYISSGLVPLCRQFARGLALGIWFTLCFMGYVIGILWPFLFFLVRKYNLAPRFVQKVDALLQGWNIFILQPYRKFKSTLIPYYT